MRGAILAGGRASRFGGRPKGLEPVGGTRIVDRVAAAVELAIGQAPLLVANDPQAQTWLPGVTVISDVVPDCGSLGGIYTALVAGDGPVLVVAWDMPFVTAEFLAALIGGAEGWDAVVPQSEGPRGVEPLCAVYGPACREPIRRMLEEEDYRAIGFHDQVRVKTLPRDVVEQFGPPETLFFNVNAPEDLVQAEDLLGGTPRTRSGRSPP